MSKLGVEVGDEFPAHEVRTDEDGVVHHYHYYCRRRPFRFLRFVLTIMLLGMVFRAMNFVLWPSHWRGGGPYRWDGANPDHWSGVNDYAWNPVAQLIGLAVGIAIVAGVLWVLHRRDPESSR